MKRMLFFVVVLTGCLAFISPLAQAGNVGDFFISIITPPLKVAAYPVQAVARVVEDGGSPIRWVNNIVRQAKETTLDTAEGVARVPLALVGVADPIDIQNEVGVATQAIRDGGPAAEAITDILFLAGLSWMAAENWEFGYCSHGGYDATVQTIAWTAGGATALQLIDPPEAKSAKVSKLERHGSEISRIYK